MGKSNKAKSAEKQPTDEANSEAKASSDQVEVSSEHTNATPSSGTPTVIDIMSAIHRLSQVVDSRFDNFKLLSQT